MNEASYSNVSWGRVPSNMNANIAAIIANVSGCMIALCVTAGGLDWADEDLHTDFLYVFIYTYISTFLRPRSGLSVVYTRSKTC